MKKNYVLLSISLVAVCFAILGFKPQTTKTVVIDAGHGGDDTGVVYDSILEKDVVMNISKYLEEYSGSNMNFVFLRSKDDYLPLSARLEEIQKVSPDLVISLHLGTNPNADIHGVEAFIYKDSTYSNKLSEQYGEKLLKSFNNTPLHGKDNVESADFYLIKNLKETPAVVLELGYLSNAKDRDYVTKSENQKSIAKTIVNAL
ncbi:N-acetylmuramoyl-L-alanine amidase [Pustulibacterium marinum]|uniref:N-acetylmuramoyl-L-alanine amidase n=1 Tax=Pustulibacterium marinum TaxID=1224947 RepID=A0A1I7FPQ9_9FLAO|nr:N-acetylmuramoyl-L-alanine amidase [Pustulibacterium marinum]SFU38141.1 N-acetylmuramoyl-L-alanine amidase [Pustulibacterium marinum]